MFSPQKLRVRIYESVLLEYLSFLKGETQNFFRQQDHYDLKQAKKGLEMFKDSMDNYFINKNNMTRQQTMIKQQQQDLEKGSNIMDNIKDEQSQSIIEEKKQEDNFIKNDESFYYSFESVDERSPFEQRQLPIFNNILKKQQPPTASKLMKPQQTIQSQTQKKVFQSICQNVARMAKEGHRIKEQPVSQIISLINFTTKLFQTTTKPLTEQINQDDYDIGRMIIKILSQQKVAFIKQLNKSSSTKIKCKMQCEALVQRINSLM